MADVLTSRQRSYCMSRIKGKNTKPEKRLRKALWARGYRYRVKNNLYGKPDIVYHRKKLAVFVDGCFWHGCPEHYNRPATNAEFWLAKISGTKKRDQQVNKKLKKDGWRVIRFWEHDIKDNLEFCVSTIAGYLDMT